MLVLDVTYQGNRGMENEEPMIVEVLKKRNESYYPFDTFDIYKVATMKLNEQVREWQMLGVKRISECVVTEVVRPPC